MSELILTPERYTAFKVQREIALYDTNLQMDNIITKTLQEALK